MGTWEPSSHTYTLLFYQALVIYSDNGYHGDGGDFSVGYSLGSFVGGSCDGGEIFFTLVYTFWLYIGGCSCSDGFHGRLVVVSDGTGGTSLLVVVIWLEGS